ncbi:hypothetical protein [Rosettibacter firmus]|uniref:hypothetical protein n=1 Tax=Rosettibacter firmus TaxID=3111522 RepID=UPI00336C1DFA
MFDNTNYVEIIGYLASVLVAISLMMSAIVKLRIINLIGSLIFTVYGIIISAYPVALVNGFIAVVNIYYLIEIFSTREYFDILEVEPNSEYLKYFLSFHEKEIKKFVPDFSFEIKENDKVIFVLRNSVPAGLVCTKSIDKDTLFVNLDYVIPGYRDFKIGKYVYQKFFKENNIKKIITTSGNKTHQKYLRKMGFIKTTYESSDVYLLEFN